MSSLYMARLAVAAMRLAEFDESKHNRDQRGRFSRGDDYGEATESDPKEASQIAKTMADEAGKIAEEAGLLDRSSLFRDVTDASAMERGAVKARIVDELTESLAYTASDQEAEVWGSGMVKERVQANIDLWANTSGDSNPQAIMMQRAVAAEFGLEDAALKHLQKDREVWEASSPNGTSNPNRDAFLFDRQFSRAEYENTQRFFKERGITHVTLYRGMNGVKPTPPGESIDVTMQPASSWSTSKRVAFQFATESDNLGNVLRVRVPVSRVLSTAVTGRGALHEGEVVLLGGKTRVKVIS